ncbi:hypothetical protein NDU88_000451 [Pleurodeles waltl]|uniref:Uncharacterized protein n=1 Tax=Pleurodeles waltl TaxID=8319 RepID=A0AAV7KM66_PLEWA|nr:hypothetical protein NDU88_000451 [Pleurodeles waltl]
MPGRRRGERAHRAAPARVTGTGSRGGRESGDHPGTGLALSAAPVTGDRGGGAGHGDQGHIDVAQNWQLALWSGKDTLMGVQTWQQDLWSGRDTLMDAQIGKRDLCFGRGGPGPGGLGTGVGYKDQEEDQRDEEEDLDQEEEGHKWENQEDKDQEEQKDQEDPA